MQPDALTRIKSPQMECKCNTLFVITTGFGFGHRGDHIALAAWACSWAMPTFPFPPPSFAYKRESRHATLVAVEGGPHFIGPLSLSLPPLAYCSSAKEVTVLRMAESLTSQNRRTDIDVYSIPVFHGKAFKNWSETSREPLEKVSFPRFSQLACLIGRRNSKRSRSAKRDRCR